MKWIPAFILASGPVLAHAAGGWQAVLNDGHTAFFLAANLFLTVYFTTMKFDRFAVVHGPEILTTVGIFGCFFGIALALLNFDARNVSASVPQLLEGVKTAFWASVSGVGGSLVIRARHHFQKSPIPQAAGASKSASLDDVVTATMALQKSLAGQEEGSLLSQLKLMRQEQSDQLTSLRSSFDTFAEKMAEDGSKALIDALQHVLSDFNTKINEQFGENFKQLNHAVGALLVWQQQYKEELDKLQQVQASAAQDLRSSAEALSTVASKSSAFTESAARLEQLLNGLAQQYVIIQESEEALAKVLVQMKDVMPQFSQKLDELMVGIRTGVAKVQSDTADVIKNFGGQVQGSSAELKQLLVETLKKSHTDVSDQMTRSLESVRQSVVLLDKGLQEELTKSLQTLGRQLASLSEKFVADYSPLTDRLREVVRIAGSGRVN